MLNILPPCIVRRVEKLRELNSQRETIVEQYQKERAALEKKFADLYQPLFDERKETIAGKYDREIDAKAKEDGNENEEEDAQETLDIKGIPQFWVCAMGHMEAVAELITEADVDCLENLTDVQCIDDEDGMGFALEFHFKPNTYFSNTVLRKKYTIPNLLLDDEPILKNVEGDEIKWKEGMCLTHREIKKKQRAKSGKNAGKIRTIVKKEKQDSFFHFFKPPKIPTMDEMDEEEADAIEQAFDVDYDVAQAFRSHIIPKAALWFTGEALDEGFDIAEGEWPGEEEGNDEDGDGGAEGGDAAAAAAAAPSGNSPFPPPAEGEENPECKQN
jgi:nucleosome assembly protein 1-like 1